MTVDDSLDSVPSSANEEGLIENEPYLGPAWAVAMLILYLLKEAFPAETYSVLWWFQSSPGGSTSAGQSLRWRPMNGWRWLIFAMNSGT